MNGKIDSSKTNLIYILCERGGNHLITQVKQTIQRLMKFENIFAKVRPPLAKILDTPLGIYSTLYPVLFFQFFTGGGPNDALAPSFGS